MSMWVWKTLIISIIIIAISILTVWVLLHLIVRIKLLHILKILSLIVSTHLTICIIILNSPCILVILSVWIPGMIHIVVSKGVIVDYVMIVIIPKILIPALTIIGRVVWTSIIIVERRISRKLICLWWVRI